MIRSSTRGCNGCFRTVQGEVFIQTGYAHHGVYGIAVTVTVTVATVTTTAAAAAAIESAGVTITIAITILMTSVTAFMQTKRFHNYRIIRLLSHSVLASRRIWHHLGIRGLGYLSH